jgi:hypothetical protein
MPISGQAVQAAVSTIGDFIILAKELKNYLTIEYKQASR